ncbi:hypothetical protein QR680_011913 [Steinernema hermaphroditum]|uniref:ShKT domain-containing protein n=1 Tax=Steinernema hermaphroditum TaxID=289476 RepID=A0AA39I1R6_9BILA|nr:hypothetical protein QR680_011913 [Steinernema hermaphroditum]
MFCVLFVVLTVSVAAQCPDNAPFKLDAASCPSCAYTINYDTQPGGVSAKGVCVNGQCCFEKRELLPQFLCPLDTPYVQMVRDAKDVCYGPCNIGGPTPGLCVRGICCFKTKTEAFDKGCYNFDRRWRGIECKADVDCNEGGDGGACEDGVCCYPTQPRLPQPGCLPDQPYNGAPETDYHNHEHDNNHNNYYNDHNHFHNYNNHSYHNFHDDHNNHSYDHVHNNDNAKTNDYYYHVYHNHNDKSSYYHYNYKETHNSDDYYNYNGENDDQAPRSEEEYVVEPEPTEPAPIPICPIDKPFVRAFCEGGMCPEPEDVCHLNFACCYGYEPLPTTETPTTLAPIPLTPQPPPIQGCRDHLSECRKKAYLCRHDSYRSFMITYCARSCHICTYSSPVYRPQACEDANLNCPEWVHNGFCSSGAYTKVEKERLCARSCGLCVERPEALPPPVPRPISTYTLYNVYLIPMPRIPHHV